METLARLTLIVNITIFFFGQLLRVNLFGISFPIIDLSLIALSVANLYLFLKTPSKLHKEGLLFFILNILFLLFNYKTINLSSLSYFLRLSSLLSLLIFPSNLFKSSLNIKFFNIVILANTIFSLIQYFFWPNFTYFSSQNWDPHLYRLVGTFFDPTFTALIFLLFIINIYFNYKNNLLKNFLLTLSYFALSLTYSRSTLIAFTVSFIYIFLTKKEYKKIFFIILLVTSTIFLLPRKDGEGTKLERTSSIKAKIENYKNAFSLYQKSPLLGIGYNNISQFRLDKNPQSHSNSAFDSSLINILITTGPLGLYLFLKLFKNQSNKKNLFVNSLYLSVFVHSLFANSLLYPWTLFYLIFLIRSRKLS